MIFSGRSVVALDEVHRHQNPPHLLNGERRESAVAIATGWFSSLRRPGKKAKKGFSSQKQAKSAWDLSALNQLARTVRPRFPPALSLPPPARSASARLFRSAQRECAPPGTFLEHGAAALPEPAFACALAFCCEMFRQLRPDLILFETPFRRPPG